MTGLARIGIGGIPFSVGAQYAPQFQGLLNDLAAAGYDIGKNSGGYNPRYIRGTTTPSQHAFGRAIDINWNRNARGTAGDIDPELARSLAKKYGLTWGGDWKNPDPMHFEVARTGATPMAQRGLTSYAGLTKTPQEAPSMPTYKDVGGQVPQMAPGTSPADVAHAQAMAKMLMQGGQGQPRHWAQALGNAMQQLVGGLWQEQAAKGQRGQQEASNQALTAILGGANPAQFAGDPNVGNLAVQQALANQQYERNAPMRQLQMDKLQFEAAKLAREAAQPSSPIGDAKDVFDVEQKLRKEFSGLAKPYFEVRDAYNRVEASTKEPSAAGDLALVFNFMKMLDPGSVVREGEFANAQNAAGIPERIRAWYNNVVNGQRLTDNTRSDFLNQARNLYRSQAQQFQRIQDQYKTMSGRYGLNPQNTMIDFSRPADAAAREDARKAIAAGAPRDAVLERLRQNGIDPGGL